MRKSSIKSWSLVAGALIILAACVLSYILTKPAEADVSFLNDLLSPRVTYFNLVA